MQSRTIKNVSQALKDFASNHPDVEFERPQMEKRDYLYLSDLEGNDDAFYIVEMTDGSFWANTNFTTDSGKAPTKEDFDEIKDQIQMAFDTGIEVDEALNKPPIYRGAYFKTIDEAYEAVKTWVYGAAIPKCYNPPIDDRDESE
jgi:hypothetical protein